MRLTVVSDRQFIYSKSSPYTNLQLIKMLSDAALSVKFSLLND